MKDDDGAKASVRLLFSDLLGLAHGRLLPLDKAQDAVHLCMTLMAQAFDGRDDLVPGYGLEVGSPDMEARLDQSSALAGWDPTSSVAMASLWRMDGDRDAFELDPRGAAQRAVAGWQQLGYAPVTGFEMEFYLLRSRPKRRVKAVDVPAHRPYGTGLGGDPTGLAERIFDRARAAGLDVAHLSTEFHPGQVEVVLQHTEAIRSADSAFLFRELAREVASAEGAWCTFLGKPMTQRAGSGQHLNLSALDANGRNAFADPDGLHGLSDVARHAIAGVIAHYPALCAIAAPTVNAYKRLRPEAIGYVADWGLDNRAAAVRVPAERGPATRLEYRVADGAASPHLMTAALLFAALLGVQHELELPPARLGLAPGSAITAPQNLDEALDELEKDDELTALLGPDLVRTFVGLKRWEWTRWSEAVTDWEIQAYGRHF
ncbi:glutamine synthetase family protein [Angustibacter luteus]|uniref:Glutamine synthetase family protein n=1 Tax=Angustibacter luteus TaxID=658456 RepID=A0ABW1JFR4_9ACTN